MLIKGRWLSCHGPTCASLLLEISYMQFLKLEVVASLQFLLQFQSNEDSILGIQCGGNFSFIIAVLFDSDELNCEK